MSNLASLFKSYLTQIKPSNEDLWDDYFDEVNNPKGPVDEDPGDYFQDVTGILPKAAYDLVQNVDDMWAYNNQSGRSNVTYYKYDIDWFLVKFADDSYYLYTLKSVPFYQLEEMKHLANAGKGLNGYISKEIKVNYAARQVRGEIVVRPGMEEHKTFNDIYSGFTWLMNAYSNGLNTQKNFKMKDTVASLEAYKTVIEASGKDGLSKSSKELITQGLKLIDETIGFESISNEDSNKTNFNPEYEVNKRLAFVQNISNEGFADSLMAGIKNIIRGKKPELRNKSQKTVLEALKNTYLNQAWLDKRDFVTGTVKISADDQGGFLYGNVKSKLSAAVIQSTKARETNIKVVKEAIDYAKPYIKFMDEEGWKNAEKTESAFSSFEHDKSFDYFEHKYDDYEKEWQGKTLTKEQVIEYAQLVAKLIESNSISQFGPEWQRFSTSGGEIRYDEGTKEYEKVKAHYNGEIPQPVRRAMEEIRYYLYSVEEEYFQHYQYTNLYFMIEAIISLIDASVK